MCIDLRLFTIVVWLGVLAELGFGHRAASSSTPQPVDTFRPGHRCSRHLGRQLLDLLIILKLLVHPGGPRSVSRRANAWLLIVGRLVPASTFFIGVALGFMPGASFALGIGDSTFGIIELILLMGCG